MIILHKLVIIKNYAVHWTDLGPRFSLPWQVGDDVIHPCTEILRRCQGQFHPISIQSLCKGYVLLRMQLNFPNETMSTLEATNSLIGT